ncbi:MAG: glutamate--tRNA ligase [Spirochaetes bacterium]|nr:glutamate--tRNA ligase [Spirochaetota bacterium]
MGIRVRYAPSPTGLQHIGGIRTALFNYFFAKSRGGEFILRIEDTDRERYSEAALTDLYDTLKWLGIEADESPEKGGEYGSYVQSERTEIYREYARRLVESGHAYYCYCSQDRLEKLREKQKKDKQDFGYNRRCRTLSESEIEEYQQESIKPVIRLKIPLEGETVFNDYLLGEISKKNIDISPDPVLLKSDKYPTYHLANVIDDHFMNITHILRAQEWLPSCPLHIVLYNALGWKAPQYCHLPMVMGDNGQKLSKRHGATAVKEFIEQGYLPEAIINYVSLIGWSYDDSREFFTKQELEKLFTLDKLSKSPGVFDYKKLEWFNGHYIRQKSNEELKELLIPYLVKCEFIESETMPGMTTFLDEITALSKERLKVLSDIKDLVWFFFREIDTYFPEDIIPKKLDAAKTIEILETIKSHLSDVFSKSEDKVEELFKTLAEAAGVTLGNFIMPLRVAVTGSNVSPPIIGSLKLLGIEKTTARIERVVNILKDEVSNNG